MAEATATRIGCDHLMYALLTEDDGTNLTYGTPTALPGVMKLNINPNPSQETLFADDGPQDTATTLGKIEVEIDKSALSIAEKAALLGHSLDSNGALIYGANDVPPWVAIGFRTLKSNGMYRYVWLYKGKFMEPEDNNETRGDSINFQNDTIKGMFAKVNKEFTVNGKTVKPWKAELDQEDTAADPAAISSWFSAVYVPTTTEP
jgi:phi13 family phage major tail protein